MEKKTLANLFSEFLFRIPDYQRGYAWEIKQWNDFIEDVDALVDKEVRHHYTGTVVIYKDGAPPVQYGPTKRLEVVDVVDGQQRLTTCCLYLSIILNSLVRHGIDGFAAEIPNFLYAGATCRLTLNNDTENIFYDLLKTGHPNTPATSTHQRRLVEAYEHLKRHIDGQLTAKGVKYLQDVYDAMTRKLVFTFYAIEEESEIGMTFELMNSRGKDLSVLELLKNYFMHWVSRNLQNTPAEQKALTSRINRNWKDTYTNIGSSGGDEDQCLRIAWTLYCNATPANWDGYRGFKSDYYFPLRNFSHRSKEETQKAIEDFADGLALVSRHYACIRGRNRARCFSDEEVKWLNKIHHAGNVANFLPLMVAARVKCERGEISERAYIDMLRAFEVFAYRVFLMAGKRSSAGRSSFFPWGHKLFSNSLDIATVTQWIYDTAEHYADKESFREWVEKPFRWYDYRHLLRYTLYEYELHLLETEGKRMAPKLRWEDLSDSTIEHILPQQPEEKSYWRQVWNEENTQTYLHDISNLVLTQNNSNYRNFEFQRKRGVAGESPSYANSDIRQERKIASYPDWAPAEVAHRKSELAAWICDRWKTLSASPAPVEELDETEDPETPEDYQEEASGVELAGDTTSVEGSVPSRSN